jgi:hypothetical protein
MSDFAAIATALALRYSASQLTAPTGYRTIRLSTWQPHEDVPPLPCVMVFPPESGTFDTGNGTRTGAHDWVVRFLYDQAGDLARQTAALLAWCPVLFEQLRTSVTLGGTVVSARLDSYKVGYFGYAGKDYAGVEMRVTVVTSEAWAASA